MTHPMIKQERLLRLPEVMHLTGRSRTAIYAAVKSGKMPAPIKFSRRFTAWTQSSIDAWIAVQIEAAATK